MPIVELGTIYTGAQFVKFGAIVRKRIVGKGCALKGAGIHSCNQHFRNQLANSN